MSKLVNFLLQQCAETSSLETWVSTKSLSFMCDCLKECFPGSPGPQPRGARARSRVNEGSSTGIKICMPITSYIGGWDSSWIPCYMVLIPQLPQRHYCLLIDAKLLLLWGRQKWVMSSWRQRLVMMSLLMSLIKGTTSIMRTLPLMTLSKPNNFLKPPSPNSITLRVKSSIYEFWET